MSEWEDIKARLSVGFMGHVSDGSCKAEKPCMGCDIRAALEEIERRGLQYPDDLGISRDAAGLSARCAELRDRLVAQGKRAEAAEAKLAEAERNAEAERSAKWARLDKAEAEVARLREALVLVAEWKMPDTVGRDGKPSTYGLEYGSNGERDYVRGIARAALRGGRE